MSTLELIKADLSRFGVTPSWVQIIINLLKDNRSFKYTFWLRAASSANIAISLFSRLMLRHYSNKYQIQISRLAVIGPGLYLGHATTIVVSKSAIIGKNCNLSHFVNIGSNHGLAATIGDNVYIGPNSCLVEAVKISDNVTIGAGSTVVKSLPLNATAVGNPSKVINYSDPAQYINNPY